jgi:hypothetical protein
VDNSAEPQVAYDIGGQRWVKDAPGFAYAIVWAHEERLRPRCLCRSDSDGQGIEMYVARLVDGYIVKRMPNTGNQHATACPSYEPSADCSGLGQLLERAISEDPATGETVLKLNFPLTKTQGRSLAPPTQGESATVASDGTKLSLRGSLHYLWDQAKLTHWHPGFAGKRTWGTVRRHLLQAAEHKIAKGNPLHGRLYIPEVFAVEHRAAINARRLAHWAQAVAHPGRVNPLMLLIAEVKEIVPARYGHKAVIKHVPDQHIILGDQLYRRLVRGYSAELEMWGSSDTTHLVMITTFFVTASGLPCVEAVSLMALTPEWIPAADAYEAHLLQSLVSHRRSFVKTLRYNLRADDGIARAVLTDTGDAVELHISDEPTRLQDEMTGSESERVSDTSRWTWCPSQQQIPKFPFKSGGLSRHRSVGV